MTTGLLTFPYRRKIDLDPVNSVSELGEYGVKEVDILYLFGNPNVPKFVIYSIGCTSGKPSVFSHDAHSTTQIIQILVVGGVWGPDVSLILTGEPEWGRYKVLGFGDPRFLSVHSMRE